ncbi:MAG: dockerin type I domain-containing protein [Planctomycetota bacterium]
MLLGTVLFAASAAAAPLDDIGYSLLRQRLGVDVPEGAGVVLGQVEARSDEQYLPDEADAQFDGKTVTPMSGAGQVSSHATTVGRNYYGRLASPAPAATDIRAYAADDWLSSVLNHGRSVAPAEMGDVQVVNHSWIQSNGDEASARETLQRADYLVERDGVVMVAGVNNGSETDLPWVMSSAYNAIAVGVTSLDHSAGPTTIDQPGRSKPDLIAPDSRTSYATPLVAGAGAGLIGEAEQRGWSGAQRPEVLKSILMAGTSKSADWYAEPGEPLDRVRGAGMLRVDRAWRIFDAGPHEPEQVAGPAGWSEAIVTDEPHDYILDLPSPAAEVTVQLSWLRRHRGSWARPGTTLDHLRLRAYDGTELLGVSDSAVDNIQHLRLTDLPSGFTRLEVDSVSDDGLTGTQYGVAWLARLLGDVDEDGQVGADDLRLFPAARGGESGPGLDADAADWNRDGVLQSEDLWSLAEQLGAAGPGDANLDGQVNLSDLALLSNNWGRSDGSAVWQIGDFDGDGNVLASDLDLLAANWSGDQPLQAASWMETSAVPEPASLAVLLAAGGLLMRRRTARGR